MFSFESSQALIKKISDQFDFKKQYDNDLADKIKLLFYVKNVDGVVFMKLPSPYPIIAKCNEDKDSEDVSSETDDIITINGIEYINEVGLSYLDKTIEEKNDLTLYPDKIVYPCHKIKILFKYPIMDAVSFTIYPKDESKGFTNLELIEKVLKYFRMIQKIHYHYDIDTGTFSNEKKVDSDLFHCPCGDYDFNVDIVGLQYGKQSNIWEVLLNDYH